MPLVRAGRLVVVAVLLAACTATGPVPGGTARAVPSGSTDRPPATPSAPVDLYLFDATEGSVLRPFDPRPPCRLFDRSGTVTACGQAVGSNAADIAEWAIQEHPGSGPTVDIWLSAGGRWALGSTSDGVPADAVGAATAGQPGEGQVIAVGFHVGSRVRLDLVTGQGRTSYRRTFDRAVVTVGAATGVAVYEPTGGGTVRRTQLFSAPGTSWRRVQETVTTVSAMPPVGDV